jgi:hypothetical protein
MRWPDICCWGHSFVRASSDIAANARCLALAMVPYRNPVFRKLGTALVDNFPSPKTFLSCGFRFARSSERTHLTDLVFRFGKVKIRLFQPQIPLAAFFIASLFRQSGALCSLPSEAYGIRHNRASDSSVGASQHFLLRNATHSFPPYTIKGCPLWVKSGHMRRNKSCPLYPPKLTCAVQLRMSALGQ